MYHTASLVLTLLVLPFFLIALFHPDYRKPSFWTAVACIPAGVIGEFWLIPDYWDPQYFFPLVSDPWRFGLEDIIITGAFAGISAAVFEFFAKKRGLPGAPPISVRTFFAMGGYGLFGCIIMIIGFHVLDLAAIYALFLSIGVTLIVMIRSCSFCFQIMVLPAGALAVIYTAILIAVFSPLYPNVFGTVWNLPNTWGVFFYGVPAEELVWAFLTAGYCGILYRVAATTRFPFGRRFWKDILGSSFQKET
jgi:hypothetical protein